MEFNEEDFINIWKENHPEIIIGDPIMSNKDFDYSNDDNEI